MLTRLTDEEWTVVVTQSPAGSRPYLPQGAACDADGGRPASLEMGGTRTVKRLAAMSAPLLPADSEAVTGLVVNNGPTDLPPESDALLRVRRLQSDLCELIRHFAMLGQGIGPVHPSGQRPSGAPAPPRGLPWDPTPRSW